MKFNGYRMIRNTALALLAAQIATFILYYLSNYIFVIDALTYVWIFVQRATYMLLPIIGGVVLLADAAYIPSRKWLLHAIPITLTRSVFLIPYYYLLVIVEGYDSIESLTYSALLTLGELVIGYILTVLLTFLLSLFIRRRSGTELSYALAKKTTLDFADPVSLSFILLSALSALYFIIKEIIDTVQFISEYGTRFTETEIIYLCVSFILDVLIPCGYYIVLKTVKNRIISTRLICE